jgi:hypothetical protein
MRVVSIEELEIFDKVVIQTEPNKVEIKTVKEVWPDNCLIVFEEMAPMDYAPEDPEEIIVLDAE